MGWGERAGGRGHPAPDRCAIDVQGPSWGSREEAHGCERITETLEEEGQEPRILQWEKGHLSPLLPPPTHTLGRVVLGLWKWPVSTPVAWGLLSSLPCWGARQALGDVV